MEGAKWEGTATDCATCGWSGGMGRGAGLVFRSKTSSADYHDKMNCEYYIEWLTEQLLPQLEWPTVIILDNASYHNKQKAKPPTSNTT